MDTLNTKINQINKKKNKKFDQLRGNSIAAGKPKEIQIIDTETEPKVSARPWKKVHGSELTNPKLWSGNH